VFDGNASGQVDARAQAGCKLSAIRSQAGRGYITEAAGGDTPMEKIITCPCGFVLRGANDDEVVEKAQDHARTVHGMELTRDQALEMARPV